MQNLRTLLDRGYQVEFKPHSREDIEEKPELESMDAMRIDLIKGDKVYSFDAELEDDWLNGFEEIFDHIIEYLDVYSQ